MGDDDTQEWLLSAACEDECRDRAAGGRECRERKATPERRTGFVSRRPSAEPDG